MKKYLKFNPDNIPDELKSIPRWVTWRPVYNKDDPQKPKKKPINPAKKGIDFDPAKTNDPGTWGTFDQAVKALDQSSLNKGLGFIFTGEDHIVGIDFDHCIDNDKIHPSVEALIKSINTYAEKSPSGTGLHLILKGDIDLSQGKKIKLKEGMEAQFFSDTGYLTFTGGKLDGYPSIIAEDSKALKAIYDQIISSSPSPPKPSQESKGQNPSLEITSKIPAETVDEAIKEQLKLMFEWLNVGPKIKAIFEGRLDFLDPEKDPKLFLNGKPDLSAIELSLMSYAAKATKNNPVMMEAIYQKSKLVRPKWKEIHSKGKTYGQMTIEKAIEGNPTEDNFAFANQSTIKPKQKELGLFWNPDLIKDAQSFTALVIPKRKSILDPFILEQSMILLSGQEGVGKTQLCLSMLIAICKGEKFGDGWETIPTPCLFVDGELASSDLQERIKAWGKPPDNLYVYSDAYMIENNKRHADMKDESWRVMIEQFILKNKIKLVCFDNVSCLAHLEDENSPAGWVPVNQFLIDLRHKGIASILIHHMGKNIEAGSRGSTYIRGQMDIIIELHWPRAHSKTQECMFDLFFQKARLPVKQKKKLKTREWKLIENEDLKNEWVLKESHSNLSLKIMQELSKPDPMKGTDMAEAFSSKPWEISRCIKKLEDKGFAFKKQKKWKLTQEGQTELELAGFLNPISDD